MEILKWSFEVTAPMAPTIQIHEREVSPYVLQRTPVGAHEYFLDFSVKVEAEGCYTLDIRLLDHDSATGEDTFAAMTAALRQCYCFQTGERKRFHVRGGGAPPPGALVPEAAAGSIELPGLTGRWPASDGPFDDTLEVFARVSLLLCRTGSCDEAERECEPASIRRLGEPVRQWRTRESEVEVLDTSAWEEGLDLMKEGGSAAGSLLLGKADNGPLPANALLANMNRRLRRLEHSHRAEEAPESS